MPVMEKRFHPALLLPLCAALLALYAGPARALPSQSFQVSASVVAGCQIEGGGGVWGTLDFGTYSALDIRPVGTGFLQNSALTIACTPGTTLSISIDGGRHYTATRNLMRLNGNDRVAYRLYSSAGFTPGSEIPVNQSMTVDFANAANITLPIYGQLQLDGTHQGGTYTDILSVVLSW
ncbi:spore coat protein U-like protein [Sodalis ligni]|jgi:spore coat protein U-like protein|uniref:Spore coat protein U-like protein n=2 Tax=Sodalis ligni TaxID=2697027 RepID=A0A4R1NCL0_9GAMM|nr:spore coat protein U-like protein [Sodalis ligni]